jgi:OmpA-OmpF porin, OOP family
MSKKTLYLLGILATIIIGSFLYHKMCCCQECCKEEQTVKESVVVEKTDDLNIFKITGNDFNYDCPDNFRFLSNDFKNLQPVNDCVNVGIGKLKTYFEANPKSKIMITGYAMNSEKNTSAFPNLALARANDLKDYFVSKGIAANRFEMQGELRDTWKVSNDTVLGAADFKILQASEEKTTDWAAMKAKYNANPLILYFSTNQAEINLTTEERQKVADLVNYLDNVAGSSLNATGHTDNVGDRTRNTALGLNRANFAKDYLSKNGIQADRIEASSKGPDEPIAENTTAEGKAKNRRTVVTIK